MINLKEKVAYLQGLTQGLSVSENTAEGKILLNIVDVLENMADEFHNLNVVQEDLETYIENIDEDLTDLEKEIYEEEMDQENLVETKCPHCHEAVVFESAILNEDDEAIEVTCPYCGETVYDNTMDFEETSDVIAMDNETGRPNAMNHSIHPGV